MSNIIAKAVETMGVKLRMVLGLLLFLSSAWKTQAGCPYANTEDTSTVRHKRDNHPFEIRPSVISDGELDELLKSFSVNSIPNSWLSAAGQKKPVSEPIKCGIPPPNCLNDTKNLHYRSIDGACNNLLYPAYGIASSRYTRLLQPNYVAQTQNLPNSRHLSLAVYGEKTLNDKYRTVNTMQWGQFVAHDISEMTTRGAPRDCCTERHPRCQPIALPANDPMAYHKEKTCLHFARSVSDADAICPSSHLPYSEKLSVVTSYLDLSSLYGNTLAQSRRVRLFKAGQLRSGYYNDQHWLPVSHNLDGECGRKSECYSLPDKRNRFTPTIAVLQTLLLREHNRLAEQLASLNPHYDDERLFQEARKINIAQYQKITYYDWLQVVLGSAFTNLNGLTYPYEQNANEYVHDYDESVNAGPYAEYAAAAFRYSHTQIPGWFSLVSPSRYANQTLRLSDYFERSETIKLLSSNYNFADLVRGMATQLQKRSDANIDREIKHYFNRKESEHYGSDLKMIDIERARDFGLASYNDARELCGLQRASYWSDFANEIPNEKITVLRNLYATPDDVELSVGGTLEFHVPDSLFGPTMLCIVGKQFLNTRRADRFFFEHENHLSGFSRAQLAEIRKVSLASLFCNNVPKLYNIQPNVFIFPNIRNAPLNCNEYHQLDISKWQDQRSELVNEF